MVESVPKVGGNGVGIKEAGSGGDVGRRDGNGRIEEMQEVSGMGGDERPVGVLKHA